MNAPWRRMLLLGAALALLLGLAWFNPGLFFMYLIDPIARILWLLYHTLRMVDQAVYWAVLTLAAFILGLRMIPGRRETTPRPSYLHAPHVEDRVAHWEALLRSAEADPNVRLSLQHELTSIQQTIGDAGEGNEPAETRLPPVHAAFWRKLSSLASRPFLFRLIHPHDPYPGTELNRRVAAILAALENQLETNHDRSANDTDGG